MTHTPPCAANPELWFSSGTSREARADRKQAIAICHTCPLIDACRKAVNDLDPQHGIWAGENLNRGNPKIDRINDELLICGTEAGHARHRRRKEPACRPCIDAATREKESREERVTA